MQMRILVSIPQSANPVTSEINLAGVRAASGIVIGLFEHMDRSVSRSLETILLREG